MKILVNLIILIFGFIGGFATMNYLHEDRVQIVEKEVIKTIEKSVPMEVEKLVYRDKKCPKANKSKVCAEYISKIKDMESDMVESEQALSEMGDSLEQISKLNKPSMLTGKKNRVNFLVGYGRVGNSISSDGSNLSIQEKKDMIYGLQFERKITKDISGSISVHSNNQLMFGAGIEY
jgi:hypothetical protein